MFHIFTVLSALPLTIFLLKEVKHRTGCVWPDNTLLMYRPFLFNLFVTTGVSNLESIVVSSISSVTGCAVPFLFIESNLLNAFAHEFGSLDTFDTQLPFV